MRDERFWNKVDKSGECWLWTASTLGKGYGQFWDGNKRVTAHRFSWVLHNGPIPEGLHVLHHCDVPVCVNPEHLWLGTNADNVHDCMAKGRTSKVRAKGEQSGSALLTQNDVLIIRNDHRFHRLIAADYGVARSTIQAVKSGHTWADA